MGRLHALGLQTVLLPLGISPNLPHIPILTSPNLASFKRVIFLFYEHTQDLGILAHRVIGGSGGINKGSCVDYVKAIQALPDPPGIVLANSGQLMFNRRRHRAMTQISWLSLPQSSAVGQPPRFDPKKNTVEGNRNTQEHISYVMDVVRPQSCADDAKIDIIAVSDSATEMVCYLNRNIEEYEERLGALALCAPYHSKLDITSNKFAAWLAKRGRAYIVSTEPANIALAGVAGSRTVQAFGCPTYSIGEPYYPELMLVKGLQVILDQFEIVHSDLSKYGDYENDQVLIFEDESEIYDPSFPATDGEDNTVEWRMQQDEDLVDEDEGAGQVLFGEHAAAIKHLKENARRLEIIKKVAPDIGI